MKIILKFLIFLLYSSLFADTEEEAAEKLYIANINALLILTSESGLSSGKYRLTNSGHTIETYSLPFRYHLEPFEKGLNIFINGGVGYSRTKLILEPESAQTRAVNDINLTLDNKIQTYTGGLGIGLRYKTDLGIEYLGSFGLIYSRVGTSTTPDNPGSIVEDLFETNYNDNLTYKFLLACEYHKKFYDYTPFVKLEYKSFETKTDFSFDALADFSTQSSVAGISLGIETPALFKYEKNYFSLEGFAKGNYIFGDMRNVVQFTSYANIGATAYLYTPDTPFWASRFYTEISTVRAKGLEGYNVGIGFTLDY